MTLLKKTNQKDQATITDPMNFDVKHKLILLEALEDMLYKLSMQLEDLKGKPLTGERKVLTKKQEVVEELQHLISMVKT